MPTPNFRNRTLYHCDNLPILRGMNSETIDLIATDPPFNKGRDFHATPDSLAAGAKFQDRWSWADDIEGEWVDRIIDDWPKVHAVIEAAKTAYGEDMAAFLCFMGVRLIEMYRVLKPTGSLYMHLDDTASAWVKCLMDAIFGEKNFRNEIIWRRYGSHNDAARKWGRVHDTILYYSKGDAYNWTNEAREPYDPAYLESAYRNRDSRGRYSTAPLHARALAGGGYEYQWKGIKDLWRFPKERLDQMEADGLIHWPKRGKVPRRKVYLDVDRGVVARDVVTDIKLAPKSERTGYPTQKPLALYERIIKASSNEGDIVLDPFCGCATTPVAAERLNRQWVGIDIWDGAFEQVLERMEKESNKSLRWGEHVEGVQYETQRPIRTDDGGEAVPFIQVTEKYAEPPGPRMSRQEMYEYLLAQHGQKCQGCDRTFDDPRYLELDHNTPRSDGGLNHITNRILLCSPCNRAKSNVYTLSGLRRLNNKNGWMAKS